MLAVGPFIKKRSYSFYDATENLLLLLLLWAVFLLECLKVLLTETYFMYLTYYRLFEYFAVVDPSNRCLGAHSRGHWSVLQTCDAGHCCPVVHPRWALLVSSKREIYALFFSFSSRRHLLCVNGSVKTDNLWRPPMTQKRACSKMPRACTLASNGSDSECSWLQLCTAVLT